MSSAPVGHSESCSEGAAQLVTDDNASEISPFEGNEDDVFGVGTSYDVPVFEVCEDSSNVSPLTRLLEMQDGSEVGRGYMFETSNQKESALSQRAPLLQLPISGNSAHVIQLELPDLFTEDPSLPRDSTKTSETNASVVSGALATGVERNELAENMSTEGPSVLNNRAGSGQDVENMFQATKGVCDAANAYVKDHELLQKSSLDGQNFVQDSASLGNPEQSFDHRSGARPSRGRNQRILKFDGLECSLEASLPELSSDEARANRLYRYQVRRRQRSKPSNGYQGHPSVGIIRHTPAIGVPPLLRTGMNGSSDASVGVDTRDDENIDRESEYNRGQRAVKNRLAAQKPRKNALDKVCELQKLNADLRSTVDRLFHINGALHVEMGHLRSAAGIPSLAGEASVASHLASIGRAQTGAEPFSSPTAPADAVDMSQDPQFQALPLQLKGTRPQGASLDERSESADDIFKDLCD